MTTEIISIDATRYKLMLMRDKYRTPWKEIARRANLSDTLIKYFFNGQRNLSDETLSSLWEVVKDIN